MCYHVTSANNFHIWMKLIVQKSKTMPPGSKLWDFFPLCGVFLCWNVCLFFYHNYKINLCAHKNLINLFCFESLEKLNLVETKTKRNADLAVGLPALLSLPNVHIKNAASLLNARGPQKPRNSFGLKEIASKTHKKYYFYKSTQHEKNKGRFT